MTEVEKTASEIIDLLLEEDFTIELSFNVKLNVMIESLGELIEHLLEEEEYEICAMYRDTITELKRYGQDGDKAAEIIKRMQT